MLNTPLLRLKHCFHSLFYVAATLSFNDGDLKAFGENTKLKNSFHADHKLVTVAGQKQEKERKSARFNAYFMHLFFLHDSQRGYDAIADFSS